MDYLNDFFTVVYVVHYSIINYVYIFYFYLYPSGNINAIYNTYVSGTHSTNVSGLNPD